jgi:HlyD family secretion protein
MKRWLTTAFAAIAMACLWGCGPKTARPDGSGTIECTQVQISPLVAGRILSLPPREGTTVKEGDLVAKLDSTDYELKLVELKAMQVQAEAQLDLLLAGSRQEDILRGKAQFEEAKAAERATKADLLRTEELFDKQSASRKQLDDAKALAERAVANVDAAGQVLNRLENGNRQEEIRIAKAQADQARARVAQTEKAIRDCTVTSPAAGFVTDRIREDGEYVAPGAPLVTLSRLDDIWLSVYIPESRLGKVKLGQPAWVRIDGDPAFHPGFISFVAAEAEFTPRNVQTPEERAKLVYRLRITLENRDRIFKPGMPADGYLKLPAEAGTTPKPAGTPQP